LFCLLGGQTHGYNESMSAQEVIEQIKTLPPDERGQVAKLVAEQDDSRIPREFKDSMKQAMAGQLIDMDKALFETPPPHLQ
jgi:hypothetical protein